MSRTTTTEQRIIVIGSGAREHAWARTLLRTNSDPHRFTRKVYVCPGNSGMREEGIELLKLDALSPKFVTFCKSMRVDLVVVGPEQYLMSGVVDTLTQHNIICFGPKRAAARIEGSKLLCKQILAENNIPTAKYWVRPHMQEFLQKHSPQSIVIKASGLAAGKGVVLPSSYKEALNNPVVNGEYGSEWFVESRLEGQEVSLMAMCNGFECQLMPQAQDYKRIYDNDRGPNTGGMGAIAPVSVLSAEETQQVHAQMTQIVKQLNYRGILYAGLMKTTEGVFFLECNCRMGDPEAQVLLTLAQSDMYAMCRYSMLATAEAPSFPERLKWKTGTAVNIVLSHCEYPRNRLTLHTAMSNIPEKMEFLHGNVPISIFSGSMENLRGSFYTKGGRVASVCAHATGIGEWSRIHAIQTAYDYAAKHIDYAGKFYRRDIGRYWLPQQMAHTVHIAVLGSTRGSSLRPILDQIKNQQLNVKITVVLSNRKRSQLLDVARENGIPAIYLPCKKNDHKYDEKIVNLLRTFSVDALFLVGYMKIVSPTLIDEYASSIFNIHPSLLPKYAGGMDISVHEAVIQNKEKWTGCTLHHVTSDVDGGTIVDQRQLRVQTTNPIELKQQVQQLESECIAQCLRNLSFRPLTYKIAGVNIDTSNAFVNHLAQTTSISTQHFGAVFSIDNAEAVATRSCFRQNKSVVPSRRFAATTDGVGTKIELAIALHKMDTIGIDLVAMSVNDLYAQGVQPLYFLDYLALDRIHLDVVKELVSGVQAGCQEASCELIGGETAEMRDVYRQGKCDMAGFALGEELCSSNPFPRTIQAGYFVYGLPSSGFHSNGYTLVRRLLDRYSRKVSKEEYETIAHQCLKPTRIYHEIPQLMSDLGDNLRSMAHITGGGLLDNVSRMLPQTHTLRCKFHDWTFPALFKWAQKEAQLSCAEMLSTFNCGYGFVCILKSPLPPSSPWQGILREIGCIMDV